jgi:hypothetical protein
MTKEHNHASHSEQLTPVHIPCAEAIVDTAPGHNVGDAVAIPDGEGKWTVYQKRVIIHFQPPLQNSDCRVEFAWVQAIPGTFCCAEFAREAFQSTNPSPVHIWPLGGDGQQTSTN